MCAYYTTANMSRVTDLITLNIVIADKYFKNQRQGNLNDTESDTLQVARDVYNVINKSVRWQQIGKVESATFNKFMEKGADECAGGVLAIQFKLYDNESICDLPMQGYDFDSPSTPSVCADVLIINSDGTFSVSAASGSTYSLEDTTMNFYDDEENLIGTITYPSMTNQTITVTPS